MNRQQALYFVGSIIVLFVGMGLFPLLPSYAAQFGATRTLVGLVFTLMAVFNAAGYMLPGWLPVGTSFRRVLIAVSALGVPALALLARATALWQAAVLLGVLWFSGGAALALFNIFTGFASTSHNRGRSFSLNSLGFPLGALLGGAAVGTLVERLGYPAMFGVLAVLWAILPVLGLWAPPARVASRTAPATGRARGGTPRLGPTFHLLLGGSIVSMTAISISRLGWPLTMQGLHFVPGAISVTNLLSGLATVPAVLLIGALSDRVDRTRLLSLVYGFITIGALMLTVAYLPWHFWAAATFMLVALCGTGALTLALATDMLGKEALGRALPRISGGNAVATIVTSATTGYLLDTLGPAAVFLAVAGLGLVAIVQVQRLANARRLPARGDCADAAQPGAEFVLTMTSPAPRPTGGC